jgi:hypothetical protein
MGFIELKVVDGSVFHTIKINKISGNVQRSEQCIQSFANAS